MGHTLAMKIRNATTHDVQAINELILDSAERDRMLFRSIADIYENLQTFFVADENGTLLGCCALDVIWSDLAEVKSLTVSEQARGKGVGRKLVAAAVDMARDLCIDRVFALTLEPVFFDRVGFHEVAKETLPMKVWRDCARCPKQQECDEIAVLRTVASGEQAANLTPNT